MSNSDLLYDSDSDVDVREWLNRPRCKRRWDSFVFYLKSLCQKIKNYFCCCSRKSRARIVIDSHDNYPSINYEFYNPCYTTENSDLIYDDPWSIYPEDSCGLYQSES